MTTVEIKVMVIGMSSVGKKDLVKNYCEQKKGLLSDDGVTYMKKIIVDDKYLVDYIYHFWIIDSDTSFDYIDEYYYRISDFILYVYNPNIKESLEHITKLKKNHINLSNDKAIYTVCNNIAQINCEAEDAILINYYHDVYTLFDSMMQKPTNYQQPFYNSCCSIF